MQLHFDPELDLPGDLPVRAEKATTEELLEEVRPTFLRMTGMAEEEWQVGPVPS